MSQLGYLSVYGTHDHVYNKKLIVYHIPTFKDVFEKQDRIKQPTDSKKAVCLYCDSLWRSQITEISGSFGQLPSSELSDDHKDIIAF